MCIKSRDPRHCTAAKPTAPVLQAQFDKHICAISRKGLYIWGAPIGSCYLCKICAVPHLRHLYSAPPRA